LQCVAVRGRSVLHAVFLCVCVCVCVCACVCVCVCVYACERGRGLWVHYCQKKSNHPLQHTMQHTRPIHSLPRHNVSDTQQHTATHCNILNTLQHTATRRNTLYHTATHSLPKHSRFPYVTGHTRTHAHTHATHTHTSFLSFIRISILSFADILITH